jgi:hypothetical protein
MKGKVIFWIIVLIAVFLAGFIPQYVNASRYSHELETTRNQLSSCQFNGKLCQLRDLAALMYMQTNEKNFGLASENSKKFFSLAQEIADQTTNPELKQKLNEILASRQAITAELSSAEPSVVTQLRQLMAKTFQATRG